MPVILLPLLFAGCQGLSGSPNGGGGNSGSVTLGSSQLDFGKVAVGGSKALQDSITNSTAASVTIASVSGATASFQVTGISFPLVLAAGQSSSFSVQFQPTAIGQQSQTLQFLGTGGQSYASLTVSGNGVGPGTLSIVPTSDQFGDVKAGGRQTNSVLLSNNGQTDLTISQAAMTGTAFSMGNLVLPLTIHPGQTSSLAVTFAPPNTGTYSGNVAFTYSPAQTAGPQHKRRGPAPNDNTVNLSLGGNGVTAGLLDANPTTLAFGNVQVGSNASLSETVTNTGGSTTTISQANISNAAYSLSGLTLPASVGVGQSITFTVKFTPSGAGSFTGNLSLISDAGNSPLTIPLSGTGVTPGSLSANPTSLAFGNVQVGSNASLSETVTNTGGSAVTISQANISNAAYSLSGLTLPANLSAGQSVTFTVKFTPSGAGSFTGNLSLVSNDPNSPLTIPLSGTGVTPGSLSANPTSLAFGSVQVGSNASLSETVTNTGGSAVTISQANISNAAYSLSGLTLPANLSAGQSVTFTVKFTPSGAGSFTGNLSLVSNAPGSPLTIPLSGTGVTPGNLSANPTSLAFGNVQVGSNASLSETVTNTGGSAVTISQANISNAAYSLSGLTLPANLSAGQSVTFTVKFTPSGAGSFTGNLSLVSNAPGSPLTIPLSGTGVTPGSLSANPTSLAFGSVQVGSNASLSETVTNTGGSAVTISQANISNAAYSLSGLTLPANLSAGQSVTFTVKFTPSGAGSFTGNLSLVSNAPGSPLTIPLSGTGVTPGNLSANPTSLAFGNVQVGSNASLSETVTNTGGSAVTITSASLGNAAFSISGLTLPANLSAGQSVTFTVKFTPSAAGSVTANLTLVSNAGNSPLIIGLSGTGTALGQLGVSPASLGFGNVVVGASSTLNSSLNATGAAVTVSSATSTSSEFTINGLSLPAVIAAGQSLPYSVTFAPSASGTATATLTFVSNASNSPTQQTATGNGLPPSQHSVDLSWNPSGSQGVVGYNLYRGDASGGPYSQINTSLDVNTNYTDDQVAAGQTYYYVATAVDGNGVESGYSNEARAVIPQP